MFFWRGDYYGFWILRFNKRGEIVNFICSKDVFVLYWDSVWMYDSEDFELGIFFRGV